ncbi:MAG: MFS transporter [Pseudomonadota bacterium]
MSEGAVSASARRYAMVILATVYMFNFVDRQVLAILLPSIRAEFQVDDTVLGLLAGTAFALFYVTLGIPIARLADRFNRRNLIAIALALWSGMTALSGLAANIWHLTLARIGVGVGEAGCSPSAHSMISDLYPPEQRSTAMGFYTLGISAGIMLAYVAGGWIAQNIGWREAFFVVGMPGLVLALVVWLTVPEPQRGASENRIDSGGQPTLREVLRFLSDRRSFRYISISAALAALVGYAHINFMPSFFVRSFGMDVATLGIWLGPINGVVGGAGFFFGGYLADRVGRESHTRALRFIAASLFAAAVCFVGVFLANDAYLSLALFALPSLLMNFNLAPSLSQTQSLVSLRMRAVASALILLILNVVGLGFGPLITGAISDLFEPAFGSDSMRYSLLTVTTLLLPLAGWGFWRAGHHIEQDLGRADEMD